MAEAIRDGLRLEAIAADIAGDGDTALELLGVNAYDIAVLDRDVPGPTGDEIARRIVASGSGMPILMLTAADRLDDKATGFELGADDYLTKPFELQELRAPAPRARPPARPQPAAGAGDRRPAAGSVPPRGLPRRPLRRADPQAVRRARGPRRRRGRRRQRRGAPGAGVGRERRPVHQRRAHHGLGPAQAPRRALDHRHRGRRRLPHRHRPDEASGGRPERPPQADPQLRRVPHGRRRPAARGRVGVSCLRVRSPTSDLRLPDRAQPDQARARPRTAPARVRPDGGHRARRVLLVFGLLGGWLLAGRMLAPAEPHHGRHARWPPSGSLSHRIELQGRSDEFRELADAFDAMLARLEAHVAEQQRFAANASHELRTPLAITQTLLDVARSDPDRDDRRAGRPPPRRQRPGDRPHRGAAPAQPRRPAVLHPRARRPVPPRGGGHRDAAPARGGARRHHRDLRRRRLPPSGRPRSCCR